MSVYILVHYGIWPHAFRANMFVVIEILRFGILYSICYYFCKKSSGLLTNRKQVMLVLRILYFCGMTMMLTLGIWMGILIYIGDIEDKSLCTNW